MKDQNCDRFVRLLVASDLATMENPTAEQKQILEEICKGDPVVRNVLKIYETKPKDIVCNFCGGELGDVEKQDHSNPNFAEYRTCLKCGYQWAKEYWAWLAEVQGVKARPTLKITI